MKNIRLIFLSLLLIGLGISSSYIFKINTQKRVLKEELIELSNIKYGMFNVDEWKRILSHLLSKKIEEFEINGKNKTQVKKSVSDFLYRAINEYEAHFHEQNKGSIGGLFKNIGASAFHVFDDLKAQVPVFTEKIVGFLNDPKNKRAVKTYLTEKLEQYADSTFAQLDYTLHDAILQKYSYTNRAAAIHDLNEKNNNFQLQLNTSKYILLALAIALATFLLLFKTISKLDFLLMVFICLSFLLLGLALPMIEIDARIAMVDISLLGEHVKFDNQVLFYKSKSILEVVNIMITQGQMDLLLVGLLVLVFSVLFPLSKLVALGLILFYPQFKSNRFVSFLVFKTGKWSMADVMVVAIFMSYVGFSGILTEQLNQIEALGKNIELLTTNQSSLQIGFFAFTAFSLLSLLLTSKLPNVVPEKPEDILASQ